jgi:hypothetical protein
MKPEKEEELKTLGEFLRYYATRIGKIPEDSSSHPFNVLTKNIEMYGKSKALEGLRQAVNDCIEDSYDWNQKVIPRLDKEFRDRGLVTISELRMKHGQKFKLILKRGKIRNETEFYMLNGIVCDTGIVSDEGTLALIEKMIGEFEAKVGAK